MRSQFRFRTLIDLFHQTVGRVELLEKVCLEIIRQEREEKLTFGQLKTRAQDFALWLIQAADIKIKDKVAVLGKNRIDWDVAFWGIVLAGAVPVLIDPERLVESVKNHVAHTDCRAIVMADDYQDADARGELRDFVRGRGLDFVEMTRASIFVASQDAIRLLAKIAPQVQADDTAIILCTSGTTGDPREVELTHANLIANIEGSVEKIRITEEDRLGHILPPHHSFGLTVGKFLPFCAGAANIYTNKYRQISELIRDRKITIFVAVPALYTVLAKNIEDGLAKRKKKNLLLQLFDRCAPKVVGKGVVRKLGWDRLRFFLSGSAPVPKWVLDVFWRRGLLLYEGYGTTENSPVYGFNESPRRLGSVGKPISTLTVQIVNERNRILPPGEKGEICLGGPCIMKGYYKNAPATETVIRMDDKGVRWLHTGDLGYLDEDGNLLITGRKKYLIVLPGGKKVNPELVEAALSQAQFVKEVLVVPGYQVDSTGISQEAIKAIVQPAWEAIEAQTNLSYADLVEQPQMLKALVWKSISECQRNSRQLSGFEKVSSQHVEIKIDEFQKTGTGKIKREAYIKV